MAFSSIALLVFAPFGTLFQAMPLYGVTWPFVAMPFWTLLFWKLVSGSVPLWSDMALCSTAFGLCSFGNLVSDSVPLWTYMALGSIALLGFAPLDSFFRQCPSLE